MTWPTGVTLRTCTLGPDFGIVSGSDYGCDIVVSVSRPSMTWGATGSGGIGDTETLTFVLGQEVSFQLPVTDQAGWYIGGLPVDLSNGKQSHVYGLTIKPWIYNSLGRKTFSNTTLTLSNVAIPSGTDPLDLDMSVATSGAQGGTVTLPDLLASLQASVDAYKTELEAVAAAPTDSFVADRINDPASETTAALNAAFAPIISAVNGEAPAATLTRINAALASGPNRVYRLIGDFTVNGPIAVPSNVTVDASAATFTLVAASYTNLLSNAAALANVRTIYAAMTSGSGVLTAAGSDMSNPTTGPFTAGLVGKPVVVQGAGANGAPLVSTVTSYQSTTQITLADNAATTVSGQYATVGARDKNITIIGGTWTRASGNNNWGSQGHYLTNTMRFRHVDGLRIVRPTFNGSTGKYAVNPGDCTDVLVESPYAIVHTSDLVHINGPAEKIIVNTVVADSIGDDMVSLTAGDSVGANDRVRDVAGDITNVTVNTVKSKVTTNTSSCLKIIAGRTMDASAPYHVIGVRARDLVGPNSYADVVFIGDATDTSTSDVVYDDIEIDGVTSLGSTSGTHHGVIDLHGGVIGSIKVRNVKAAAADNYNIALDHTVKTLTVDGLAGGSGGMVHVSVASTGILGRLGVKGANAVASAGVVLNVATGGAVTRARFYDTDLGTAKLVNTASGTTLGSVEAHGTTADASPYPLGVYQSTTDLFVSGLVATGGTNLFWVQGSGAVTIRGAKGISAGTLVPLGAFATAAKPAYDN